MEFFIIKILAVIVPVVVLCLPFFPSKFNFSLASAGYSGKRRWRNIIFVAETFLVGSVLVCVASYIKKVCGWLLGTKAMLWLTNLIPDRLEYIHNVVTIIAVNFAVCVLFIFLKKTFRRILDAKLFNKDTDEPKKKKNKKNRKNAKKSDKDLSEKRLKQLRRNSVLVFGKNAKKKAENRRKSVA